jgi:hypothetical protein
LWRSLGGLSGDGGGSSGRTRNSCPNSSSGTDVPRASPLKCWLLLKRATVSIKASRSARLKPQSTAAPEGKKKACAVVPWPRLRDHRCETIKTVCGGGGIRSVITLTQAAGAWACAPHAARRRRRRPLACQPAGDCCRADLCTATAPHQLAPPRPTPVWPLRICVVIARTHLEGRRHAVRNHGVGFLRPHCSGAVLDGSSQQPPSVSRLL